MVYATTILPEMLGFLPERSTKQNLEHGEALLRRCNHGSVHQIHEWWQNPNMYYAFETKEGARWMSEHGGPKRFLQLVESVVPENKVERKVAVPEYTPRCYSCSECFEYFTKPIQIQVCRCMCGTRVTHPKCFMPKVCPICNIKMSKSLRKEAIQRL